jgi:hypothetical protein
MVGFVALPATLPRRNPRLLVQGAAPVKMAVSASSGLTLNRRAMLSGMAMAAVSAMISSAPAPAVAGEPAASNLAVKFITKGTGPKVNVGDLVAIRFKGSYNDIAFDNIFETPEPYFYRCGSELILKVRSLKPWLPSLHRRNENVSFSSMFFLLLRSLIRVFIVLINRDPCVIGVCCACVIGLMGRKYVLH